MDEQLMPFVDDLLVGNAKIDAQHRELVKMANEFYNGVKMGGILAKVYFLETIKKAVQYVKEHFTTEENMMLEVNYPDLEEHKQQHKDFVDEVTRQIKIFESQDNPDPMGFVNFLAKWISNHIATADKKYAPYLEGRT